MSKTKVILDKAYFEDKRASMVAYVRHNPEYKQLPNQVKREINKTVDIVEALCLWAITSKMIRQLNNQIARTQNMLKELCGDKIDFMSAGWGW